MSSNAMRPLDSLVRIKGGKRLPANKSLQTEPNSHPYIRVCDLGSRALPRIGLEYVPDEIFSSISRYIVNKNDLILSIVGTVGALSIVDEYYDKASLTENCVKLSGLNAEDILYLYYYLSSDKGQEEIRKGTVGAVQPKLPIYNIEKINVFWPNPNERKVIASILGTFDDHITLLHETNATLEAIALALFKSWFVDFDPVRVKSEGKLPEGIDEATAALFSDAFHETELGMVPRGWEVKAIGEILNRPRVTKRYTKDQVQKIGNSPVYEQGASILLGFHNDEPSCNATPEMPLFIFGDHTCVTKLSCEPFDVSQNVIVLEGSVRNSFWTYFAIKGKQKFEEYRRHWMELIAKKIVVPPSALCDFYSEVATPLQLKIDANLQKIQTLTNLRDTLLPRLISGQLRIADAEKVSA